LIVLCVIGILSPVLMDRVQKKMAYKPTQDQITTTEDMV